MDVVKFAKKLHHAIRKYDQGEAVILGKNDTGAVFVREKCEKKWCTFEYGGSVSALQKAWTSITTMPFPSFIVGKSPIVFSNIEDNRELQKRAVLSADTVYIIAPDATKSLYIPDKSAFPLFLEEQNNYYELKGKYHRACILGDDVIIFNKITYGGDEPGIDLGWGNLSKDIHIGTLTNIKRFIGTASFGSRFFVRQFGPDGSENFVCYNTENGNEIYRKDITGFGGNIEISNNGNFFVLQDSITHKASVTNITTDRSVEKDVSFTDHVVVFDNGYFVIFDYQFNKVYVYDENGISRRNISLPDIPDNLYSSVFDNRDTTLIIQITETGRIIEANIMNGSVTVPFQNLDIAKMIKTQSGLRIALETDYSRYIRLIDDVGNSVNLFTSTKENPREIESLDIIMSADDSKGIYIFKERRKTYRIVPIRLVQGYIEQEIPVSKDTVSVQYDPDTNLLVTTDSEGNSEIKKI